MVGPPDFCAHGVSKMLYVGEVARSSGGHALCPPASDPAHAPLSYWS